jgi:uncharacterized protein (TIGR02246 family)
MTRPTALPPAATATADDPDRAADAEAIRQVVMDIEAGFNTNDVELSVRHFTADASAVSALGVRHTGRDALVEAHRAGYGGPLADEHSHYEVDDVVFLGTDVALAHKRAWPASPSGELLAADPAMVALYVMVRRDGRWWIAARANTLVQ